MSKSHQPASAQPGNPASASAPAAATPAQAEPTSFLRKLWNFSSHRVVGGLVAATIIAITAAVWGLITATGAGTSSPTNSASARSTSAGDAKAAQSMEPVPAPTPWYQALSGWGALIASLAAVGGLLFTGFSVRYQAEQTKLQTAASKTQTDEQNKQQARLVNVWPADEFAIKHILVTVSNRSQEPVYEFRLYVAFKTHGSGGYLAVSTWSSFPPCTQVTFNLRAIAESYRQTAGLMGSGRSMPDFDYGIMFKDATGQTWHRHASGSLHRTPWLEYLTGTDTYNPVLPPVFHAFTPLLADNFTTPEGGQRFVTTAPTAASACDSNV